MAGEKEESLAEDFMEDSTSPRVITGLVMQGSCQVAQLAQDEAEKGVIPNNFSLQVAQRAAQAA